MKKKPPQPLCKAFLVCSRIVEGPDGETALIGLPSVLRRPSFPASTAISFFARLTSAHGDYRIEVQLQTPEGETVWRDGPPDAWPLIDPLMQYDLKLNLCASFPKPGPYDVVLLANGDELARQPFPAEVTPPAAKQGAHPGDRP